MQNSIPQNLVPLVHGFLQRRQTEVGVMKAALNNSEFAVLKLHGHRLKGNGASFGFPEMTEIGMQLEMAADQQDLERARALVEALATRVNFLLDSGAGAA